MDYSSVRVGLIRSSRAALFLLAAITALSTVWSIIGIYRHTALVNHADTRVLAQRWIESNVPQGSHLAMEPFGPPVLDTNFDVDVLRAFDESFDSENPRPTYTITSLVNSLGGTRPANDVLPFLEDNDIDFVVVSSAYYGRFYGEGLKKHAQELATAGQKMHDVLVNNLIHVASFVPDWQNRPGPVIQIFEVPVENSDLFAERSDSFEPFPGLERPVSAVGYYQFQPWK